MYLHVPKTLKLLKQVCKPLSNFVIDSFKQPLSNFVIDSFKQGSTTKTTTNSAKIYFQYF
jgi:hypothetical protein